ncbi:MAG: hypothetical protein QOE86_3755 [Solirubrobacteraceae bacterium]|nr:hypothetical protein [Solirubrobacteraceae bacterium]
MRRVVVVVAAAITGGAAFAPAVAAARENPYFPLRAGMRWVYAGHEGSHQARDVVRIAARKQTIDGIRCTVVLDWVFFDGRLAERTTDWYAADRRGTVRYYGEATAELDRHGRVKSRAGSWRAGRAGARPGIYMPAHPRTGQAFAQEHFPGQAEDHFRIVSRRATISVPYGTFTSTAMTTREWSPLEPGVRDRKWFVRGVGQVAEATVRGGSARLELVSLRRR